MQIEPSYDLSEIYKRNGEKMMTNLRLISVEDCLRHARKIYERTIIAFD